MHQTAFFMMSKKKEVERGKKNIDTFVKQTTDPAAFGRGRRNGFCRVDR